MTHRLLSRTCLALALSAVLAGCPQSTQQSAALPAAHAAVTGAVQAAASAPAPARELAVVARMSGAQLNDAYLKRTANMGYQWPWWGNTVYYRNGQRVDNWNNNRVSMRRDDYIPDAYAAGFTAIRLPGWWGGWSYRPGGGEVLASQLSAPWTISQEMYNQIDWSVDKVLAQGRMAVILNFHEFDELMQNPQANRARFVALWEQIARYYKARYDANGVTDQRIIFELLNEPHYALERDPALWDAIAADAIRAIRRISPDRAIIVGGVMWNDILGLSQMKVLDRTGPFANDPYLIGTFHSYEPHNFTLQGSPIMPKAGIHWPLPAGPRTARFNPQWYLGPWDAQTPVGDYLGMRIQYTGHTGGLSFANNAGIGGAAALLLRADRDVRLEIKCFGDGGPPGGAPYVTLKAGAPTRVPMTPVAQGGCGSAALLKGILIQNGMALGPENVPFTLTQADVLNTAGNTLVKLVVDNPDNMTLGRRWASGQWGDAAAPAPGIFTDVNALRLRLDAGNSGVAMWTITDPAPNAHALRLMVDRDVSLRIGCGRANGDDSNPGWQNAQTFKAHVEYRLPMRGRGATSCNRLKDVEALGSIWIQAGDSSKPVDARFLQLQVEFGDGRRESLVEPAADAAIGRNQTIVAQGAAWGCAQNRPVLLGEFGAFNSADDVMNPPAWLQSERAHWLRVTREAVEGLHGKSCAAVGQSGGSISLSWALWTFHDKQQFGIYDWSQADRSKRFIPELTAALGLPKPPPAN